MTNLIVLNRIVKSKPIEEPDEGELQALLEQKEQLQYRLKEITFKISQMNSNLSNANKDTILKIKKLEEEIAALFREQAESVKPKSNKEDDLDKEFDKYEEYRETYIEFETPPKRASRKAVLALFRKIAAKTHPDKTDDPEKHLLFIQAKAYKDEDDLEGLERIWDCIINNNSLINALLKRIKEAIVEIGWIRSQISHAENSLDYQLAMLYDRDPKSVLNQSRLQLQNRVVQLEQHLFNLKIAMGKVVPSYSSSSTTNTNGVYFVFGKS